MFASRFLRRGQRGYESNMISTNSAIVVTVALSLVGAVAYTIVYMPYFSSDAEVGRNRTREQIIEQQKLLSSLDGDLSKQAPFAASVARDHAPGSMWKNITAKRELMQIQQQHQQQHHQRKQEDK
jgi:hypothetical protein